MKKQIKRLRLKNFQSHEDTVLDLVPGLNVLLGNSDTGKSAIVRAIRWLFYNEPSGDEFLQRGKSEVEVEAEFYDGSRLKRSRTKSKNAYDLTLSNGESMHFEGFGRTVPQEILDYLQLKKFQISPTDQLTLNIADQLEGPFLLQEKDSTKANAIGRLVGIHYIDQAQRNVNRDILNLNREQKYEEEQLDRLKEARASYDYIDASLKNLDQFKEILKEGKELEGEKAGLEELLGHYQAICREGRDLEDSLKSLEGLDRARQDFNKALSLRQDYEQKSARQREFLSLKENLEKTEKEVRALKDLDQAKRDYSLATRKYASFKNLDASKKSYDHIQDQVEELEKTLKQVEKVDLARKVILDCQNRKELLDRYTSLRDEIFILEGRIKKAAVYMQLFENMEAGRKEVELGLEKKNKLESLLRISQDYTALRKRMEGLEGQKKAAVEKEEQYKKDLRGLLSELRLCPVCERPMDEHTISHIVEDRA